MTSYKKFKTPKDEMEHKGFQRLMSSYIKIPITVGYHFTNEEVDALVSVLKNRIQMVEAVRITDPNYTRFEEADAC